MNDDPSHLLVGIAPGAVPAAPGWGMTSVIDRAFGGLFKFGEPNSPELGEKGKEDAAKPGEQPIKRLPGIFAEAKVPDWQSFLKDTGKDVGIYFVLLVLLGLGVWGLLSAVGGKG